MKVEGVGDEANRKASPKARSKTAASWGQLLSSIENALRVSLHEGVRGARYVYTTSSSHPSKALLQVVLVSGASAASTLKISK